VTACMALYQEEFLTSRHVCILAVGKVAPTATCSTRATTAVL